MNLNHWKLKREWIENRLAINHIKVSTELFVFPVAWCNLHIYYRMAHGGLTIFIIIRSASDRCRTYYQHMPSTRLINLLGKPNLIVSCAYECFGRTPNPNSWRCSKVTMLLCDVHKNQLQNLSVSGIGIVELIFHFR